MDHARSDPATGRLARAGRRLATPAGLLAVAAAVAAACGAFVHHHGFVVMTAIGSTLAVGLAWPWVAVRSVSATVAFDRDRGRAGEPAGLRLAVRNRGPLRVGGLVLIGLGVDPVALPTVGPFRSTVDRLTFVPNARGLCPTTAGLRLTCGRPFGLWHPTRNVPVERPLLVWPGNEPTELPVEVRGRRSVATTALAANAAGGDDETHGVRPYRRGDPLKLLHHAQTARHDRLIVRELSGAARPAVRLVIDTSAASYADDPLARERAIRVAVGLLSSCAAAGLDADVVVEGRVVRPGREVMDALARVGTAGGPGGHALLACPAARVRGRVAVWVTSAGTAHDLRGRVAVVVPIRSTSALRYAEEPDAPAFDLGFRRTSDPASTVVPLHGSVA